MKQTKTIQQKLGDEGEKLALHLLRSKGIEILATNWRTGHLELDIIGRHHDELIIVEVKTRGTFFFGTPESAVTKTKIARLAEATEEYLIQMDLDLIVRYDIIAVMLSEGQMNIEHFEDAFYPGAY